MFPLPSTSGRVVLVVRHFGPFAHCYQQASEQKGIRAFSISNSGHVAQKHTHFMVTIFWLTCTVFGVFSYSLVQR
jgi:hypothetical protein